METARYIYTHRATQYHDTYMRHFDLLDQAVSDIRAELSATNASVQQLTQTVQNNHYEVM